MALPTATADSKLKMGTLKGVVFKSTGSNYIVRTITGKLFDCGIRGQFRLKGIKNTNPIAVGDKVSIETANEHVGTIVELEPRKNYIIRKSINLSKQYHIIASNIDQAFLIVTPAFPRTSTGFIDRFLVTAEAYRIPVTIVFNKSDLYDGEILNYVQSLTNLYADIGYETLIISTQNKSDIELIEDKLKDKTTLISGHSGVGKSTLINKIVPDLKLKTGEISDSHNKGMHTTTFAEMFEIKNNTYLIDTPGIKELGIVDMKKEELGHFFPEMRNRMLNCKFNNCKHLNEPGCAVIKALENGEIAPSRYNTYLSILEGELSQPEQYKD